MSIPLYKEFSEYSSTEGDSCSDRQQELTQIVGLPKTNPLKHKTELCKTFSELGFCNYGEKCRFAHGRHQLLMLPCKNKLHKNRKCKGFWKNGICPYGIRCQFGHFESDWTSNSFLIAQAAIIQKQPNLQKSRLLTFL